MTLRYRTIAAPSEGLFRDRGSKFLAFAFPVPEESACKEHLLALKKAHPKARHHCYAYRLGFDGALFRANDDGEPSGTAGRPILGQIDHFELTNVLVVVVRYFGGTLLGTSGLIRAYRESTRQALEKAAIEEREVLECFRLQFEYEKMSPVMEGLKKAGAEILSTDYGLEAALEFAVPRARAPETLTLLKAAVAGVSREEAETLERVPGLVWEALGAR
ncbi:MAG: YigZ family protein [Bacteroidetes bacterium]|nr:MAG: YigZ family protein [Bacteroidota bacterium]